MLQVQVAFELGFQLDQPLLHRPQGGLAIPNDITNQTEEEIIVKWGELPQLAYKLDC